MLIRTSFLSLCRNGDSSFGLPSWTAAGSLLGVALDLDAGAVSACVIPPREGHDCAVEQADWKQVTLQQGTSLPQPSLAAGGALFPAVSCYDCAGVVRVNLGLEASRGLRVAPPSSDYRPLGEVCGGLAGVSDTRGERRERQRVEEVDCGRALF